MWSSHKITNDVGFGAEAVDWTGNKDKPVSNFCLLDLSAEWGQKKFWVKAEDPDCKLITWAPPCGSASRAREKRRLTGPDPKPLRDDANPDGVPGLVGADLTRVLVANKLYRFVAEAIPVMNSLGIAWIVENPANSLMWQTSFFAPILRDMKNYNCRMLQTQMCMHGGKRDKKTALLHSNLLNLSEMELLCDGKHEHLPWGLTKNGVFATAEERNYPVQFCNTIARLAARSLGLTKLVTPAASENQPEKVYAQKQPRRGENDLVPEFGNVVVVSGEKASELLKAKENGKACELDGCAVKVLDVSPSTVVNGSSSSGAISVGKYWTKKEFVMKATELLHPYDRQVRVPSHVAETMCFISESGPDEVEEYRKKTLEWLMERW